DVYIPGCPPTPQALIHGLIKLQEKIDGQSVLSARWYQRGASEAIPVPLLGPDLVDPRDFPDFAEKLKAQQERESAPA
ncbi:MAG TPA: NADH-quinone oxidoreductase subunit B, partial [Anaerolineales bacterium]|nr:NADH-quinone oxidoreductase subunit B [Anaerolineales bacterium]